MNTATSTTTAEATKDFGVEHHHHRCIEEEEVEREIDINALLQVHAHLCRGISAFEFCPEVRKPTLDCTDFDDGSSNAEEKCPAVNQQADHFKCIYQQQS